RRGQITLPAAVRKVLGIEQGDLIEIEVRDGQATLRPTKLIDKDQAYYWTEEWQKAEREADEDIASGRVLTFNSTEELIDELHRRAAVGESSPKGSKKLEGQT